MHESRNKCDALARQTMLDRYWTGAPNHPCASLEPLDESVILPGDVSPLRLFLHKDSRIQIRRG